MLVSSIGRVSRRLFLEASNEQSVFEGFGDGDLRHFATYQLSSFSTSSISTTGISVSYVPFFCGQRSKADV